MVNKQGLGMVLVVMLALTSPLPAHAATLKVQGAKTLCTPLMDGATQIREGLGTVLMVSDDGGSEGGIKKVYFNKADLACVVRLLTDKESRILAQKVLGYDYLVAVVKQALPVNALTREQIKKIFTGTAQNWRELDPAFPDLPIAPILTRKKSGTTKNILEFFIIDDTPLRKDALLVNSMTSAPKLLSEMNEGGGIAIMSRSFITDYESQLKVLELDGVVPTPDNVRSGTYAYGRPVTLVYKKTTKKQFVINSLTQYLQNPEINFFKGELLLHQD